MSLFSNAVTTRRLALIAASAAALGACGEQGGRTDTTAGARDTAAIMDTAPRTGTTGAMAGGQAGTLTDGNIAAILAAADQAEIRPSELARERAQNPQVRQYAERMIRDHGMLTDSVRAMAQRHNISPQDNQMSQQMRAQADSARQRLEGAQGPEFDRQYMQYMVESHRTTLEALNNQLIPSAQNPQLRAALEQQVRPAVQQHLEQAQQLQGNLGGAR